MAVAAAEWTVWRGSGSCGHSSATSGSIAPAVRGISVIGATRSSISRTPWTSASRCSGAVSVARTSWNQVRSIVAMSATSLSGVRALRPGGRLTFLTPGRSNPDGAYARATAALGPHAHALAGPARRGLAQRPGRIREVLAGHEDIGITPLDGLMDLGRDAADAAGFLLSTGPVRFNLDRVEPATVARVRDEVREGFTPYETPGGVRVPGAVLVVSATSP